MTFHELTPSGVDSLRDEGGFISDVSSDEVEKALNDSLHTIPSILTLLEVNLKVDEALDELESKSDAGESLDDLAAAKVEESSLGQQEDYVGHEDQNR